MICQNCIYYHYVFKLIIKFFYSRVNPTIDDK